jgi:hypothetical protein
MENDEQHTILSPTVLIVLDQFTKAMREDISVEEYAIERLERILRKGVIPNQDEISAALFNPSPDGEA